MATLQVRLQNLGTRIATECKAIRTLLNGNAVDNSALLTTAKGNLVAAINELKTSIDAIDAGAIIDDTAVAGGAVVWSVDKVIAELAATATSVAAAIIGGASGAYDTLVEIQAILVGDDASIATIMTALGNRVRVDTAAQGLTGTQKGNARTNIDAYGSVELGNPDTDLVAVFEAGL